MKPLPVILAVVVSLCVIAFTAGWTATHQDHIVTPAEESSYVAAVCYAAANHLPPPPPLQFGDGKFATATCDVSGA